MFISILVTAAVFIAPAIPPTVPILALWNPKICFNSFSASDINSNATIAYIGLLAANVRHEFIKIKYKK